MSKLAVKTGLYPLLEYLDGKLITSSVTAAFKPVVVNDYLKGQGRFSHLKDDDLKIIQKIADENMAKYKI